MCWNNLFRKKIQILYPLTSPNFVNYRQYCISFLLSWKASEIIIFKKSEGTQLFFLQQSKTTAKRIVSQLAGSAHLLLPQPIAGPAMLAPSIAQDPPPIGSLLGRRRRHPASALRWKRRRRRWTAWRCRLRHGSAVADAAGIAVLGSLAVTAQHAEK
jgi:hypothetical protein